MFLKFQADHLFTGTKMLGNEVVLVMDEGGRFQDIVPQADAGESVTRLTGILCPGFINAHSHLELSHMHNRISRGTGLVDFVFQVVNERHLADEVIDEVISFWQEQMFKSGIVAVGDICNNNSTLNAKKSSPLSYYNFIESSGWVPSVAAQRFNRSKILYEEFLSSGLTSSIVPHAPYSVSEDLWQMITPFFENKVVTIHNQESPFENDFFMNGSGGLVRMYEMMNLDNSFHIASGKTSLQTHFHKLEKAKSVILVHNTFTTQADIDYIKDQRSNQLVSFCICINANQYIEKALPPIEMLIKNNCTIILGTDSMASNYNLDMVEEMKTIQTHFPDISLEQMLGWATLNGAVALGMQDDIGSFEKGKSPGVVLIENVEEGKLTKSSNSRRLG